MSLRILGSRAIPFVSKRNRRIFCSVAASSAPKEPLPPASSESDASSTKQGWNFLKFALLGTLTGATAAAGYATYGSILLLTFLVLLAILVSAVMWMVRGYHWVRFYDWEMKKLLFLNSGLAF